MTDTTRLAALEAVVEAARKWHAIYENNNEEDYMAHGADARLAIVDALAALDALPAPATVGDVVTLAVWSDPDGYVRHTIADSNESGYLARQIQYRRLGTVTLPLTAEVVR